jgi:hypothetical protein
LSPNAAAPKQKNYAEKSTERSTLRPPFLQRQLCSAGLGRVVNDFKGLFDDVSAETAGPDVLELAAPDFSGVAGAAIVAANESDATGARRPSR